MAEKLFIHKQWPVFSQCRFACHSVCIKKPVKKLLFWNAFYYLNKNGKVKCSVIVNFLASN